MEMIRPDAPSARTAARYKLYENEMLFLLRLQENMCGLCPKEYWSKKTIWFVDHDHKVGYTGGVRGLLCQSCNTKLGKVTEETMTDAQRYYLTYNFGGSMYNILGIDDRRIFTPTHGAGKLWDAWVELNIQYLEENETIDGIESLRSTDVCRYAAMSQTSARHYSR